MSSAVQVRFISDIACPFCYIGFKQLVKASEETKIPVSISYHSYLLNPNVPAEGYPRRAFFKERFGIELSDDNPMHLRLGSMGKDVGINFAFTKPDVISNTQKAQALLSKAKRDLGPEDQIKLLNLFYRAYFEDGLDVGNPDVYLKIAKEGGLVVPPNYFETEEGKKDLSGVFSSDREAKSKYNVSGVPTFVFEEKYSTSGAQGVTNLSALLKRVNNEK